MKKKKIFLVKHWLYLSNIFIIIIIMLFSVNKTVSGYKTSSRIFGKNALPIYAVEPQALSEKEVGIKEFGNVRYNFDVVNGLKGKDEVFYTNEVDMSYYVKIKKEDGDLDLRSFALYYWDDDDETEELTKVEFHGDEIGWGPIQLEYKKDDQTKINRNGYVESKYVKRIHFVLIQHHHECEPLNEGCHIDINQAGENFRFHVELKFEQN